MATRVSFDDLMADVEESFKSLEFAAPDGTVYHLRSVATISRPKRTVVFGAVKVVNGKSTDVDKQERALDDILLAVVDNPDEFRGVLNELPLGAKVKLLEAWSEATQAPES